MTIFTRRVRIGRKWAVSVAGLVACAGLVAGPAGAAAAAQPTPVPVAAGLDQPHGVAIGSNGDIYVAEVGNGRTGPACKNGTEAACVNDSGAIVRITPKGVVTRIVSGLPSVGNPGDVTGAAGVAGVAIVGHWIYAVIQNTDINAKTGKETFGKAGALLGDVIRAPLAGGRAQVVAKLGPYEAAHNPDHGRGTGPEDPPIDSDPYGVIAYHGGVAVADAAGNDILMVTPAGRISTLAVLPLVRETAGAAHHVLAQPVPTSLAIGPDGALYVGELGGGAGSDVGDVNVYRIVAGHQPVVFASKLTMIGGIAFDPSGRLLVLEIDTAGLNDPMPGGLPSPGALVRVSHNGKVHTVLVGGKALLFPLGLAVGPHGGIDVSNFGVLPATGGPLPGASGELVHIG